MLRFEIGYSIGLGKRINLTRNSNFGRNYDLVERVGLFDTIGYREYSNENDLAKLVITSDPANFMQISPTQNPKAPIFLLNTPVNGQAMIAIQSRIKKSRLNFKAFIPQEEPRLSAVRAIADVSSCFGVIIPLLPQDFGDATIHNIRAAFVAGLALALQKVTLILQPKDGPAPMDVRDIVSYIRTARRYC